MAYSRNIYAHALKSTLDSLGYVRVRSNVFRAKWSTAQVEHVLITQIYDGALLACDFSAVNRSAIDFARSSLIAFEPASLLAWHLSRDSNPYFPRWPLGAIAGWNFRNSLDMDALSEGQLTERVRDAVHGHLFPIIRDVSNVCELRDLLLRTDDAVAWHFGNGAIRAGQIILLNENCDVKIEDIEENLSKFLKEISFGLTGNSIENARKYVRQTLDAARAL